MEEIKKDPDEILKRIQRERKGKLTVFLGAMAGVGKTFTMLQAAHERMGEGLVVIAGWVETHGRKETEALLEGIETLEPRVLDYRDRQFEEMDVDALLERKPDLALVDELAHTNIPGSRNSKRYEDVALLLEAGISVYTTLNIQHVESLNDVVAQITGIEVGETVPDRVLDEADSIHVVDVATDELIQRMEEGKVYLPALAEKALLRFFRPGNINALRELALRRAASCVDHRLIEYRQDMRIDVPWPVNERVLACISSGPFSEHVLRAAKRLADSLRAELLVVHIETSRPRRRFSDADGLIKNLDLAEDLGGRILNVRAGEISGAVLDVAHENNVTQLVVGKPLRPAWVGLFRPSLVDRIVSGSKGITVHIVPGEAVTSRRPVKPWKRFTHTPIYGYLLIFALIALITLVARTVGFLNDPIIAAILYLIPVVYAATRFGAMLSILAALVSVLAFDLFFVEPYYTITVDDLRYLVVFAVFLSVALITATLANRLRFQLQESRRLESRTRQLLNLSRRITSISNPEGLAVDIVDHLSETFNLQARIYLPDVGGSLRLVASSSPQDAGDDRLDSSAFAVAHWAYEHGRAAGMGTNVLPGSEYLCIPIEAKEQPLGVVAAKPADGEAMISPEQRDQLEVVIKLIALALNRMQLEVETERIKHIEESERLRTSLLNSVSHDLRTPLSAIIGAVTGLLDENDPYSDEQRLELLNTIKESASHLDHMTGNLLNMARLESGLLQLHTDYCDMVDVVSVALRQMDDALAGRKVDFIVKEDIPLADADFGLLEQVLINLFDNAIKYSPAGSPISVRVSAGGAGVVVGVESRGPVIPERDRARIFDKFLRLENPRLIGGSGLGLSICKGIVEAHGGNIWVEPSSGEGNSFVFSIPAASVTAGGPGEKEDADGC